MSSPTYYSWWAMRWRCQNPRDAYYGGRGITIDPRWDDFAAFVEDMGERPNGMTLDRIDPSNGYSKSNCRWATKETQANNCRSCRYIEADGERLSVAQWARRLGISATTIYARLNAGWDLSQVLSKPRKITRKNCQKLA